MSPRKLIAARDPRGMRPLCIGKTREGAILFASESCALDALGAEFVRDVEPGEVVVVENGEMRSLHCKKMCIRDRIGTGPRHERGAIGERDRDEQQASGAAAQVSDAHGDIGHCLLYTSE